MILAVILQCVLITQSATTAAVAPTVATLPGCAGNKVAIVHPCANTTATDCFIIDRLQFSGQFGLRRWWNDDNPLCWIPPGRKHQICADNPKLPIPKELQ